MSEFRFLSTDRVRVPEGALLPAGVWAVDGEPSTWPFDTVNRFPPGWLVEVVVIRGGGRDVRGNPLPVTEIAVGGCLLASRTTSDPVDRSDLTQATGVLYRAGGVEVPLRKES